MNNRSIFLHATNFKKIEQGLSQAQENSNFEVVGLDLFQTKFVASEPEIPLESQIVIGSSRTVEWLRKHPTMLPILATSSIFVVGMQTGLAFMELTGQTATIGSNGFQSLPVKELAKNSGIVLGGEHLANPTQQFLDAHPHWQHRIVYRRVSRQYTGTIEWSDIHSILVTSPRVGDEFARLGMPTDSRILCLGPTTKVHMESMQYTNVKIVAQSITETVVWFSQYCNRDTK